MKPRRVSPRRASIATVAIAALIMMTPTARAEAPGWRETRSDHGIRVYKRDMENTRLMSFKGVGVVDAPADQLLSVALDTRRMPEWVTSLKSARVVQWIDYPTRFILYYWMDLPWPARDRDFVSRVTVSINPRTHVTRVDYVTSSFHVPGSGKIRGELGGSYYILEPINGGRATRVTGVVVVDPRGKVPKWIVNLYQRDWPHDLIMDLRERTARSNIQPLPEFEDMFRGLHRPDADAMADHS